MAPLFTRTRRRKALWLVAVPLAMWMGATDAHLRAQQGNLVAQPMASRSGIELNSLDRSVNPCDDFYQFACGGWTAAHPAPPDQPRYGRFEDLQNRNNEILHDILDEAAKPSSASNPDLKKIGDYYASCMDETTLDAKGLQPLEPDLQRIAGMRDKNDLAAVIGKMHTEGEPVFFFFTAQPDFKDASQYIPIYVPAGMGLPDRDYYLKDDPNTARVRQAYEQHVTKMLQLSGDAPQKAQAEAGSILRVETALAKASLDRVSQRNPSNIYHKMTRDEIRRLMPAFNLSTYLENAEAPPGDAANVTEPEYLKAVNEVLATTPLDELKTYMRWTAIHSNATVLPTKFQDETFAFYGGVLTGAKADRPRWKKCVDAVDSDLGEALGKVYVERTFGPEGKERTLKMVEAIEASRGRDIQAITWMSDVTKKQAQIQLSEVTNKIGYPDRWRDYSALRIVRGDALGNSQRANTFEYRRQLAKIGKPVDTSEWGMTPPTVNAYYNPLENNINFPAGILQPPFYIKAAGDAVNFGAAAAVVGHELTHGFDDEGRRFDGKGNLRDWWTPADGKAFDERATCVADQYSGYTAVD
ncbi:MAG TPA: M13 family metallopeptidase, partial [Vicinamibacterales bacterium]|nr:M13 family metallopeptidase [Vicinamibacterales bacterium]